MLYTLLSTALGVFVTSIIFARLYFAITTGRLISSPHLHDRIWAVFTPFEGQAVSDATLRELEREATRVFEDLLTGVGLLPGDWRLAVELDDVLGPVPRICGPGGRILEVAEFEERVRKREIELPSG